MAKKLLSMVPTGGKSKEQMKWDVKEALKDYLVENKPSGLRTAECVSPGHPDKVCDQISDAILDAYLFLDPDSRVAIETMGGHGIIYVVGEVTSRAQVDIKKIALKTYRAIGYTEPIKVCANVVHQSPQISSKVDNGGAGDQGIMVGYACSENEDMIPQELYLARKIIKNLPAGFGPDAKSQVTLDEIGNIVEITVSAQVNGPGFAFLMSRENKLREYVRSFNPKKLHVNIFTIGGFEADTGLTGRKLAVDNYGPQISIGGGCFSGKDATKVDRSAAYMARKIAVDYVKAGANTALVKLAYSIGVAEPVMATVLINGVKEVNLLELWGYHLTPQGIISSLKLKEPKFSETAKLGHFGNGFDWD